MRDTSLKHKNVTPKVSTGNKKRRRKKKQKSDASKTGVHPSKRLHGVGIWGNDRVTMTVRVDEGLKKAFIPFSKRVFGSVCLPIESFMAGLMGAVAAGEKNGVYPSSTVPLKLDVGKIVIERNLRPRRKLEFEEEVVEREVLPRCGFCGKPLVVARFRHLKSGIVKDACDFHAEELSEHSDWVEVISNE